MSAERRINIIQGHLAGSQQPQSAVGPSSCQAAPKSPKGVSRHGGDMAAQALVEQGVKMLFTLTGGHIAPILTGANQAGIRVIDVRDEATAVFAADAVSRMVGIPGVAVVTAGPGLTNTITAVKNAQLAQSPVVVFAGATSMLLKGRGSLQDIDQFALMKPHCKLMIGIKAVNQIIPAIRKAFRVAQEGVPGPVFIEYPLEVLWPRDINETTLGLGKAPPPLNWSSLNKAAIMQRVQSYYLKRHMDNVFENAYAPVEPLASTAVVPKPPSPSDVQTVFAALAKASRPVILVGSQAVRGREAAKLASSLASLGAPVYLSGMGRGLLGKEHRILMRHKRGVALAKADFILLAGVPADFRLNYGRDLNKTAFFATVNLCSVTLRKNNDLRKPDLLVHGDALTFLVRLADLASGRSADLYKSWSEWFKELQKQQEKREQEINKMAEDEKKAKALVPNAPEFVSPIALCRAIDQALDDDSVIVADGGDFVGTASYIVRPRGPLSWLDPGVFGTLGVGGGFLAGAKAVRPASEVWALYGDGAAGWSLSEFDTYVRHKLPIIAVIGNDACWSQMYRDQIKMLKDAVATELAYTHYEEVARGFGAEGILVTKESELFEALQKAKRLARQGKPVLVNVLIAKSGFREGSISL